MADAAETTAPVALTRGIKGFDANLRCRGFQFEIGGEYRHAGRVKACWGGFHAIVGHPLAVFGYYAPAGSRYCYVDIGGATDSDDSEKVAAEILRVGQEIGISDLVAEAVKWVTDRATPEGEAATGDQGAASATGYRGAASATGDQGAASATGGQGAAMACGRGGSAAGAAGCALFLAERNEDGEIVSVWAGIVGRDGIEPGTFYTLRDGAPVPA